ncbi:MAG: NUDIX hydrolase [Candidatus Microsaccharimonas sp.]
MQQGQYPNAFYRVSVKAVIFNEAGEVFSVHEGEDWTLPGGGVDHGEDPLTALKRELYEEAFVESGFEAKLIGTESFYVDTKDAMAFWLVYELRMNDAHFAYQAGEDADEVAFRNPDDFKDSASLFEQFIFKYATKNTAH